jgi:hypothetical protein
MLEMRTEQGKIKAYISEYRTIDEVKRYEGEDLLNMVSFSNFDLTDNGYTVIGEAEISLRVLDEDQILSNKIASLTRQKQSIIAEAQAKATVIEGQIQSLLAITYKPEVESE